MGGLVGLCAGGCAKTEEKRKGEVQKRHKGEAIERKSAVFRHTSKANRNHVHACFVLMNRTCSPFFQLVMTSLFGRRYCTPLLSTLLKA